VAAVQDKSYPRDYMVRGRIRVELTNEDGTAANEKCPTRARPYSERSRGAATMRSCVRSATMRAEVVLCELFSVWA
jgi:hypothetical protein